jgi:prevent-host-death family protein
LTDVRVDRYGVTVRLTASQLRADIYRILDRVAETGAPVEIVRRGRRLRIVPAEAATPRKLDRIKPRPKALVGNPERLVHLDWSKDWKP